MIILELKNKCHCCVVFKHVASDLCSCPSPAVEKQTRKLPQSKCRWVIQWWYSRWYSKLQKHHICENSWLYVNVWTLWLWQTQREQNNWGGLRDPAFLACYECQDGDIYWTMSSYISSLCKHLRLNRRLLTKYSKLCFEGMKSHCICIQAVLMLQVMSIFHTVSVVYFPKDDQYTALFVAIHYRSHYLIWLLTCTGLHTFGWPKFT